MKHYQTPSWHLITFSCSAILHQLLSEMRHLSAGEAAFCRPDVWLTHIESEPHRITFNVKPIRFIFIRDCI